MRGEGCGEERGVESRGRGGGYSRWKEWKEAEGRQDVEGEMKGGRRKAGCGEERSKVFLADPHPDK